MRVAKANKLVDEPKKYLAGGLVLAYSIDQSRLNSARTRSASHPA